MLQRLVKMRKDSAEIFTKQNRPDLAEPELAQIAVIEKFLPAQLSEEEVEAIISKIIAETGASGIASMGKSGKRLERCSDGSQRLAED